MLGLKTDSLVAWWGAFEVSVLVICGTTEGGGKYREKRAESRADYFQVGLCGRLLIAFGVVIPRIFNLSSFRELEERLICIFYLG